MTTMRSVRGVRIHGQQAPLAPWPVTVSEPATGAAMVEVAGGGAADATAAADAASAALANWSGTPQVFRARALLEIARELRRPEVAAELAETTARGTGKRLAEAHAEIGMSAGFFEWFAAALHPRTGTTVHAVPGIRHEVHSRPLGVVAVSTPWNFPVSIPARKIAAALAAGCTVVFKPSEVAGEAALRLASLIEDRLPPGVLSTLIGEPRTITAALLADQRVRGISFTGSTAVGRAIAAQAVPHLTRCVLELGGNAPFVVLADADPTRAAQLLAQAKYRNNGQSCIAANTAWVPAHLLDRVVDELRTITDGLVSGDPLEDATSLGPLALPGDPARIEDLVADAGRHGARVLRGAGAVPAKGHFVRPALCVEPAREARVVTEESFGPVLAVLGYDDIEDVLGHTRRSELGLAGYVVGSDTARAAEVARALDVGIVGVNTATPNTPQIPFGGLKSSGIGWEGGQAGLDAFLAPQSVAVSS